MDHSSLADWSSIEPAFVDCVCSHVNGTAKHENVPTIIHSLTILEMCIANTTNVQARYDKPVAILLFVLLNFYVLYGNFLSKSYILTVTA